MPKFYYRMNEKNNHRKKVKGSIEASTEQEVLAALAERGLVGCYGGNHNLRGCYLEDESNHKVNSFRRIIKNTSKIVGGLLFVCAFPTSFTWLANRLFPTYNVCTWIVSLVVGVIAIVIGLSIGEVETDLSVTFGLGLILPQLISAGAAWAIGSLIPSLSFGAYIGVWAVTLVTSTCVITASGKKSRKAKEAEEKETAEEKPAKPSQQKPATPQQTKQIAGKEKGKSSTEDGQAFQDTHDAFILLQGITNALHTWSSGNGAKHWTAAAAKELKNSKNTLSRMRSQLHPGFKPTLSHERVVEHAATFLSSFPERYPEQCKGFQQGKVGLYGIEQEIVRTLNPSYLSKFKTNMEFFGSIENA